MRLSFYLDHFLAAVLINMCVSSIKLLRVHQVQEGSRQTIGGEAQHVVVMSS